MTNVSMPQHSFQRARSPEHKQQRASDLLDAARRLALTDGVYAVTLTHISAQAGVHLSGVRRYFESREEIYLRLTAEGWHDWAEDVIKRLADPQGITRATPEAIADVFTHSLAERPLFCDLLAHAQVSLERGVQPETVREFKLSALGAVDQIVAAVHASGGPLEADAVRDLVAVATSLAGSLWQTAHPAPALEHLYAEDARLAHSIVDFEPRLQRLLRVTARGLVAEKAGQLGVARHEFDD
jgi:AcrR family transcriptional regulator